MLAGSLNKWSSMYGTQDVCVCVLEARVRYIITMYTQKLPNREIEEMWPESNIRILSLLVPKNSNYRSLTIASMVVTNLSEDLLQKYM